MLRRTIKSWMSVVALCISLLVSSISYGQLPEIEFIGFEMSDTVVIGGTLTVTGTLKNNGTNPISAELALRMATGTLDDPPEPYSDYFLENNFNNGTIAPGDSQNFVRLISVTEEWFDLENSNLEYNEGDAVEKSAAGGGRVIVVIWPRGGGLNAELQNQQNAPQLKSSMDSLDTYLDSLVVIRPDEKLAQESHNANPGILKGENFLDTPLEGAMPEDIVGFRYEDDEWIQIPVQIDEMKWVNPYSLYTTLSEATYTGDDIKIYADVGTYAGADDIATFDNDDELVFMLKDAGSSVNLEDNELPEGVIPDSGVEISVQSAKMGKDTYIYLFNQDGSLEQDADSSYVSYNFSLLMGDYFTSYNTNNSNPENTSVIGDNYTLNFSDTWKLEDMHIIDGESSMVDILIAYVTYFVGVVISDMDFSYRCFVTNKEGPIRCIRSYMRGDGLVEPLDIQKTHFFYGERHDVFTNIRKENSSALFDILNIAVNENYMGYQSNIDLTPMLLDNADDSLCIKLYDDNPLEWELAQGQQGSIGIVHEVLVNGIPDYNNLLHGYWNDGGVIYGNQNIDTGNGQYAALKSSNSESGVGMWTDLSSNDSIQTTDVEFRRYTYVDEPGMSVEAMTANSNSVRQPPIIEVNPDRHYDIEISAYLEGAFQYPELNMDNSLNVIHGLLPGQEDNATDSIITPYSVVPWNYLGTECDTFANMQYPENVVDWVLVSFRTGVDSDTEVAKTMGLLTQDGTIEFVSDHVLAREDGDSFYIVVEHRNHIGIMSPTPISVVNAKLEYDFRTQNSFTNNGTRSGQKEIDPGIWAMFAGEGVQDINGNDINGNDKIEWGLENGTFGIYSPTDFNMDGSIDGQDKGFWFDNNGTSGALMR